MSVEVVLAIYLLSSLIGAMGFIHLLGDPPLELQTRPAARMGLLILMVPITGVLAASTAVWYAIRYVANDPPQYPQPPNLGQ